MKKLALTAVAMSAAFSPLASADFGLGVMTTYSPNVYKGGETTITPFPFVSYDNGHFYVEGVQAGYRLAKKGAPVNVVLFAQYDPRTLDSSESDNYDIKKMDDREATVLGGAAMVLNSKAGTFRLAAGSDVGGKHDGLYAEVRYSYHIPMGPMGLIPAIGYSFNSADLNNHLYGVSAAESARTSGRIAEFDPDWSGEYFVGLTGYMYLSKNIQLTGGLRYTNLDSELEKSPLLDNTHSIAANVGVAYRF